MLRLTEDLAKAFLSEHRLPVPRAAVVDRPDAAAKAAEAFAGHAVLKALVPAGRRGLAGAVRMAASPDEARAAAVALLGCSVGGFPVRRVYVEERIAIAAEHYLSFSIAEDGFECLLARAGGVQIEDLTRSDPQALVRARIDPLAGLEPWQAAELWLQAGVYGRVLPALADLTARLYRAFRAADAELLEINPLAVDQEGRLMLVGAMLGVDPCALFRHAEWQAAAGGDVLPENPRERAVMRADLELPGGECRYVELDGDIGLLVGGGGAGLYQHDLVIEAGGRPANHSVTPPTGSDNRKLKAVISAIFDHPRLRGLLVGFNFAQMARADIRVRTLVEVLEERAGPFDRLPIVIRLFGAGEAEARAMVAGRDHIHYVPRGTSLRDAVRLIVRLTREAQPR